jgi:hypothetical protein
MTALPIVERELRVAARQAMTWWRRVFVVGVGLLVLSLAYLNVSRYSSAMQVGQELFQGLTIFGFFYCILFGLMATSECISAEKRGGTLGLLFLTHLKGYDVVLGKLCASSIHVLLGLVSLLPLLALPILLGGVGWQQFGAVVLALLNIIFLALATGLFFSSACTGSRRPMILGGLFLLAITLGVPLLGEELLRLRFRPSSGAEALFYAPCPLYTLAQAMNRVGRLGVPNWWPYWLGVGCQHLLSWTFLVGACFLTARASTDRPAAATRRRWRERLLRWSVGTSASRRAYRTRALDRNPVFWLDDRYRFQKIGLWLAVAAAFIFWGVEYSLHPKRMVHDPFIFFYGFLLHSGICLWIGFQSGHRFAEDRQSGVLELLLCLPLGVRNIVRGRMQALRRQFLGPVMILVLLDMCMLWAHVSESWAQRYRVDKEGLLAAGLGVLVFPWQAYSMARTGLYQGLIRKSSTQAAASTIWRVGVLPWVIFLTLAILYDAVGSRLVGLRVKDWQGILFWFMVQAGTCLLFTIHACFRLSVSFRDLASRSPKTSWWWRLLRV